MNARARQPCDLALDADEVLSALDEGIDGLDAHQARRHLTDCEHCRQIADLRTKARSTWTSMKRVPSGDGAERDAERNELRQLWEGRVRRPHARRSVPARAVIAFAAATPFAIAAVVIALLLRPASEPAATSGRHDAPSPSLVTAAPTTATATEVAPRVAATESPQPAKAVRSLTVPAGSHVMLGFAIGIGALDPDGSAELVGPASATATDTTLTVQRGTVRVRGLRNVTVVVPGARLDPNGSTCTVTVDEKGVARVDVQTGRAMILGRSGGVVTVETGGAMQLDPDGLLRVPQATPSESAISAGKEGQEDQEERKPALSATVNAIAPPPPPGTAGSTMREAPTAPTAAKPSARAAVSSGPPGQLAGTPDEALSAARARMRSGETAAARSDLERLETSTDARVARRASFTLAEMDLAAGNRERARVRLDALVVCPEAALGADAATLLARTASPAERAVVWKRYLSTNPPRPYFERALLDRAEALLDSGRGAEARAILDEVKQSPSLTESQRRQLDRLLLKSRELR